MTIGLSLTFLFVRAGSSSVRQSNPKFGNQEVHHKLISDEELKIIRDNSCQAVLAKVAKTDWNKVTFTTNRGPSSLPTALSEGRPIQDRLAKIIDNKSLVVASGEGGGSKVVVPNKLSVMVTPSRSELVTSRNSSNALIEKVRGGGMDPKEFAVQMMVLHYLINKGFSFRAPIRPIYPAAHARRHPMGHPRIRRPEFLIGPRLEGPANVGMDKLPSCPLLAKARPTGHGHHYNGNGNNYDSQGKPIRMVYRIKEHDSLIAEAEKLGQKAEKDANQLLDKLALGNENPGIGSEPIGGGISELRGVNQGRVYYRKLRKPTETVFEILGKSNKRNQDKVIAILREIYL